MNDGAHGENDPGEILRRSIANGRVHSAYLLTGSGEAPTAMGLDFARALVCGQGDGGVCGTCPDCQRSEDAESEGSDSTRIVIDGKGKRGPTFRHIGDHSDLYWIERGAEDTRITIGQIRDIQAALRLGANEGGRRCVVIAEAEWLNAQAQNALLRLLEEPPPNTTIVLVANRASAIIATIRSRSVRIRFPVDRPDIRDAETPDSVGKIVNTLDEIGHLSVGQILDLAESYRGARATAAEQVTELVDVAAEWLNEETKAQVERGEEPNVRALDAFRSLQQLRRDVVQRNANPQMVAERLLLGLRDVVAQ